MGLVHDGVPGRLDSWKEIAHHLGRSVRTVVRWEREEGLPVHRHEHEKRGSVYAFRHELDAWLASRKAPAALPRFPRTSAWIALPVLLLVLYGLWWRGSLGGSSIRSLAVVPMPSAVSQSAAAAFTDQLAEDLARRLSRELSGSARVARYRATDSPTSEDAILSVNALEAAGQFTVTAELRTLPANTLLWSERLHLESGRIAQMEDELSRTVAARFFRRTPVDGGSPRKPSGTDNAEAYREYLRGRHVWNRRTSTGLAQSIERFRHAIELDPVYAQAYAALGESYALESYYAPIPAADTAPKARAAALQAIAIDNSLAEAYGVLGYVDMDYYWDWDSAERNFRTALQLDPGWAGGHHWYGEFLVAMGRYPEALAEYRRALDLDPLSPIVNTNIAHAYYYSGDYVRSVEHCRRVIAMDSSFANAHADLGMALVMLGRNQEAITECETAVRLGAGQQNGLGRLGYAYARAGRPEDARRVLGQLTGAGMGGSNTAIALIHLGMGEFDRALDRLEAAARERAPHLRTLWNDPVLEALRYQPRFAAILESMHLPRPVAR